MLIGSHNCDAVFSAKMFFFFYLISCDCVLKLCLNIPKHYDSAISVWDMWLLSYFYKNLKYMFVVLSRYQNFSIRYQYQWKSTVLGTNFGTKAKYRNMLIMHIFINKVKQK